MGTRQNTMNEERLTESDHLEPMHSPTPEEQDGEAPMLPEASSTPGEATTAGLSDEACNGGPTMVSVGQLQSKDLTKLRVDGMVITTLYFIIGVTWLMISCRWSFTDTVYFMVISVVTVGYGDITVNSETRDRVLDSLLIVMGLAALSIWATYVARVKEFRRLRAESLSQTDPLAMTSFNARDFIVKERKLVYGGVVIMVVILCVGMLVFMVGEKTGPATGLYWAIVTASTIGYGDVVPTTYAMKWFTVIYTLVATMWMVETLRLVGTFPFAVWTWQAEAKVFRQFDVPNSAQGQERGDELMKRAVVQTLGISPQREGSVNRAEFTLAMLLLLDRISYQQCMEAARVYDKLSANTNGSSVIRQAPGAPSVKR